MRTGLNGANIPSPLPGRSVRGDIPGGLHHRLMSNVPPGPLAVPEFPHGIGLKSALLRTASRFLTVLACLNLMSAQAQIPAPPTGAAQPNPEFRDVIIREGAAPYSCKILSLENGILNISVVLRPGQPAATVSVPLSSLTKVIFAENEEETALLEKATPDDLGKMIALFRSKRSLLPLPESNSGQIGLKLGNVLLASGFESNAEEALKLFTLLEAEDWNTDRRALARQGRLRAMIATGRSEEAVAEARQLVTEVEDPAILIEARYVLATAAREEFESLVEENPRWEEDPMVRPERHRLYHEIIDLYFFPYLFHGDQEEAAARGLLALVKFFDVNGPREQAAELATDLTLLYPKTPEATEAAELLKTLPPPIHAPNTKTDDASQS